MDYSFDSYQNLIETGLNEGYRFEVFKNLKSEGKFILLRHDIDIDLGFALEMAKVEANLGVKATYFIMLRSPVYNLFSRENTQILQEIIKLGHEIGLHYDEGFYKDSKPLNELVTEEAGILSNMFDLEVSAVSFHQPGEKVIRNEVNINDFYNTYDKKDMEGVFYMSDSNMKFKINPIELIKSGNEEQIQILIHPIWWGRPKEFYSTEMIWELGILEAFNRMQRQLLKTERAYGPERKFTIE